MAISDKEIHDALLGLGGIDYFPGKTRLPATRGPVRDARPAQPDDLLAGLSADERALFESHPELKAEWDYLMQTAQFEVSEERQRAEKIDAASAQLTAKWARRDALEKLKAAARRIAGSQ
jgi:hypothetical protein